jgi:hypothetical protein
MKVIVLKALWTSGSPACPPQAAGDNSCRRAAAMLVQEEVLLQFGPSAPARVDLNGFVIRALPLPDVLTIWSGR